ncbi:MAG: hypothetical protein AAGU32_04760 [Bacillota bacterium]
MAAYIDQIYYSDTYKGKPVDAADFPRLALRSSEQVDAMTFNRVRKAGLPTFDADTQTAVKNSVCAIAEALAAFEAHTDGGVVTTSESVGGYSYTVNAESVASVMQSAIRVAAGYLADTGLLYAGGCQ